MKLTSAQNKALNKLPTKSAKIRFLNDAGFTRVQIKNHLGICYQHVRNVLITPLTGAAKKK